MAGLQSAPNLGAHAPRIRGMCDWTGATENVSGRNIFFIFLCSMCLPKIMIIIFFVSLWRYFYVQIQTGMLKELMRLECCRR